MPLKCKLCRKTVSSVSLVDCAECGEKVCRDCSYTCVMCDTLLCESCTYFCESCGEPLCPECAIVTGDEDRPHVLCEECNEEMEEDSLEETEMNSHYRPFQRNFQRW